MRTTIVARPTSRPATLTPAERTQWFRDARFGMFIHWGLYSLLARGEWVMHQEAIPAETYDRLADRFHPAGFDPATWVDLARRAGQRYMVLTTRHHDGFALFNSQASEFTSVKTAAGRDFVREYAEACRAAGLKVGFYFSLMSWQFPAVHIGPRLDPAGWGAMVEQTHEQVRELMTNYGQVDVLWYDGGMVPGIAEPELVARYWRSRELNAMVRRLQPQILINDRSARPEDFSTPEQHVTAPRGSRLWEACLTTNRSWGYNRADRNFKTVEEMLRHLVYCARFGGNLLLNIGPRADGSVPAESVRRLEAMGEWLAVNGEAIYGSERLPLTETDQIAGPLTARGRRLYLPLFDWPRSPVRLAGISGGVSAARFLGEGSAIQATPRAGALDLSGLPARPPRGLLAPPVLRLELAPYARLSRPGQVLGLSRAGQVEAGDAPVLEVGSGRWSFPPTPVHLAAELQPRVTAPGGVALTPTESWCPGWTVGAVLAPAGPELVLTVEAPVAGRYDLALGLVAASPARVRAELAGTEVTSRLPGGYPDTLRLPGVRLEQGRQRLTLRTARGGPLGLYAFTLSPVWQPLPAEHWLTIGPFPTAFAAHRPLSDVRAALRRVFPPEREFNREVVYPGAGGQPVRWQIAPHRGEHAAMGVSFAWGQGRQGYGPCYARTVFHSPEARAAEIAIGAEWWGVAFLNGRRLRTSRAPALVAADGAAFNTTEPGVARVRLQAGENVLLVKNHPGSAGNEFTCFLTDPGDLKLK
jgi:alpha-L-fucosidase